MVHIYQRFLPGQIKKGCENNTDSEWKKIIDESDCIRKKYKDMPEYQFMEDLMLIVISEMERRSK